jgi:hypothetical protein
LQTLSAGQSFVREAAETNVNQRYTIESVAIDGVKLQEARIPAGLRKRLNRLIGERCDVALLEDLASELRTELRLSAVTEHLSRGTGPDRIHVDFDVVRKDVAFDISVPKFLYQTQQGWTGELDASARVRRNTFTLGAVSNGDDLTERYTGMAARYENASLGSDRIRFAIVFEEYRDQWNEMTRAADTPVAGFDLYRTRRNIAPEVTFVVSRTLTVSGGLSLEHMESENSANGGRAADAVTGEVHYGRRIESDGFQQTLDGKYTLRVGLSGLGSDYFYARHLLTGRYKVKHGRHSASDEVMAGAISGAAPLFERFVLGSSSTLRGWDRYVIDPLGGNHAIHNTAAYGYQTGEGTTEIFYDAGALWLSSQRPQLRHSLGVGYRQGIFVLTMAFPVVEGHVAPVFMAGMNY